MTGFKRARLLDIRDLNAAALQLRRAGGVLMDDTVEGGAVREAAFTIVPRAAFAMALEQIDAIVRPPGDLYFTELRAQSGKLRFLPALLRSVSFGVIPEVTPWRRRWRPDWRRPHRERLQFATSVDWATPGPGAVRCLLIHAEAEFARQDGMAAQPVALASFTDLFVQTALRELPHNHAERVLRPVG